ncbi:MAG: metal-dependent transcriptional regulator [Desulfobacterales bacterium]|jgi:DtxR family Mn-dependent transcriptional regulator
MRSDTVEDYLKAVYEIQEQDARAKTSRIAGRLGLTAGSVTEMLKRLSKTSPPLLDYRHHQGAQLTSEGRREALGVIRRHRLVETFLHRVLGLTWDEVHREAEELEHHISPRVLEAIDTMLNHPTTDPHGEPIPDSHGHMPPVSCKRLSGIEPGTSVRIVRVLPDSEELLTYLDALGIAIGTVGTVVDRAPFDGPITFKPEDKTSARPCAIGLTVADRLFVEAISFP